MPSGRTHRRIELIALGVLCIVAFNYRVWLSSRFGMDRAFEYALVFVGAYLFSSFLLSPDLDLRRSDSNSNWGILRLFWKPYAACFKHRGLSHSIILGPFSRVLYLAVILYSILCIVNTFLELGLNVRLSNFNIDWALAGSVLCGLWLPNVCHILMDRVSRNPR
jgi:uncharacterized metal-binding protein